MNSLSLDAISADTIIQVFKKLVEHIYCDKIRVNPEMAADLLVAADFYRLPELFSLCEQIVIVRIFFLLLGHGILTIFIVRQTLRSRMLCRSTRSSAISTTLLSSSRRRSTSSCSTLTL